MSGMLMEKNGRNRPVSKTKLLYSTMVQKCRCLSNNIVMNDFLIQYLIKNEISSLEL